MFQYDDKYGTSLENAVCDACDYGLESTVSLTFHLTTRFKARDEQFDSAFLPLKSLRRGKLSLNWPGSKGTLGHARDKAQTALASPRLS